ncbi:orotidine-5'-phosphate decarboxylase [bacterium]|nr:orotidine-5'-phosphate decarboxylase [bacterium]
MTHFADRLIEATEARGNPCVVGIDPRVELIPSAFRSEVAGDGALTCQSAAELIRAFSREVIDLVAPLVATVKVQAAFFECFGPPGYQAFVDTVRHAKDRGLLVIADVKRSDIGSTAAAYAQATVGATVVDGETLFDLGADAATINPYFGWEGIQPFVQQAAAHGRGVFVLVRTSNKGAEEIQGLAAKGVPLFMRVGALVNRWGEEHRGRMGYSSVGAVVGATCPSDAAKLRRLMPHALFLVPGYGAQGAGVAEVAPAFDARGRGAVVNSSRGITFAYTKQPYDQEYGEARWREAIVAATEAMIADLRAVR